MSHVMRDVFLATAPSAAAPFATQWAVTKVNVDEEEDDEDDVASIGSGEGEPRPHDSVYPTSAASRVGSAAEMESLLAENKRLKSQLAAMQRQVLGGQRLIALAEATGAAPVEAWDPAPAIPPYLTPAAIAQQAPVPVPVPVPEVSQPGVVGHVLG